MINLLMAKHQPLVYDISIRKISDVTKFKKQSTRGGETL